MEGGYGGAGGADQQRPYHGRAGQPPVARRPLAGNPGFDGNQGPAGQYPDPRFAQGPPPQGGYGRAQAPMRGGYPHPGGRGGAPPMMGAGFRGPPNGAMGPMPGRGAQPPMPRGGGAPRAPPPHMDLSVAGAGRQPIQAPMPQRGPGPGPGPGRGGHPMNQLARQMTAMELGGPAPHAARGPEARWGPGNPPGDFAQRLPEERAPPLRPGIPPQRYQDAGQGDLPGQAISDGYGGDLRDIYGHTSAASDFAAPQRSMTVPANSGFSGQGFPGLERPATTTGERPIPHRAYPSQSSDMTQQGHHGGVNYSVDYGHMGQIDDFYDSYYNEEEEDSADHIGPPPDFNPNRSSMPDFDAIATSNRRDSFEASMLPGPSRQAQPIAPELPAEIPDVPGLPPMAAYNSQSGASLNLAGPAPPGPMAQPGYATNATIARPSMTASPDNANPDALPAHPMPVRPGLMPNSTPTLVNPNVRPPPVRNYGGLQQAGPPGQQQPYPQQQQHQQMPPQVAGGRPRSKPPQRDEQTPVTPRELDSLRNAVKNNPNDESAALRLAKRLLVAANTLIPNIPDPRARGRVRSQFLGEAHRVLKRLASMQNQDAMFLLADSLGKGLFGSEPDHKEAFSMYQSAAKLGHAGAAYRTAVCCEVGHEEGGGTRKDPLKAIMWYKRAATLGDPPGMYKIGMILLKGLLGQPKNPREAVGWLKRAAEQADEENPHALHELGLLYELAQGDDVIIRDEQYALMLFQQAAELGYKFSQFKLGCAYEYGLLGCPIDARQSIVWYSRAAAQEEHQSELALSGWYLTGSEGVLAQSDTEAYLWARKAAISSLAKAEYAMGYFTEVGIGVAANLEDAKRWYWRAAAQDYPKARDRLEELKKAGKGGNRPRERISRTQPQEGECVVM